MNKAKIFDGVCVFLFILSDTIFANTSNTSYDGIGHAKTKLETAITVDNGGTINFGKITRFGSNTAGSISCNYPGVCQAFPKVKNSLQITEQGHYGGIIISSAKSWEYYTKYYIQSITSTPAILSNGKGNTINVTTRTFGANPAMVNVYWKNNSSTSGIIPIAGSMQLKGDEPDGEYSTQLPGGHPYTVTVNY